MSTHPYGTYKCSQKIIHKDNTINSTQRFNLFLSYFEVYVYEVIFMNSIYFFIYLL